MKRLIISLSLLAVGLGACNSEYDEPGKDKVAMNFNVTGHLGAPETRMNYDGSSA